MMYRGTKRSSTWTVAESTIRTVIKILYNVDCNCSKKENGQNIDSCNNININQTNKNNIHKNTEIIQLKQKGKNIDKLKRNQICQLLETTCKNKINQMHKKINSVNNSSKSMDQSLSDDDVASSSSANGVNSNCEDKKITSRKRQIIRESRSDTVRIIASKSRGTKKIKSTNINGNRYSTVNSGKTQEMINIDGLQSHSNCKTESKSTMYSNSKMESCISLVEPMEAMEPEPESTNINMIHTCNKEKRINLEKEKTSDNKVCGIFSLL